MARLLQRRTVKHPRKAHECDLCGDPITGEHVYMAATDGGMFVSTRRHVRCEAIVAANCSACPYTFDCMNNPDECAREEMQHDPEDTDGN